MPPDRLYIPLDVWQTILAHVAACLPEEACGFLAGEGGRVRLVLPIENSAHSPVRFRMNPEGQLKGMTRIDDELLSMEAIYHSHPQGPSGLSATDLAEAAYPDSALLVVSPSKGEWRARAFLVEDGSPRELGILMGETGASEGGFL
jgi:[CysO sulfur-carrier protein]-S-L-cysteine hydrolase